MQVGRWEKDRPTSEAACGRRQQSALMTRHGKLVLHWPLQVQGGLLHALGKPLNPGIRPVEATAAPAASVQM